MNSPFPIIAKIKSKKEVATGTLMVEYDLQGNEVDFKPGQFFFVELIDPPYTDERGNRRHFSIVNSPNQKGVLIMTTRLRDSGFKKSLQGLPIGTDVKITAIGGSFVLPEDTSRPLVFLAGGIGITPFMSMLKYISENNLSYRITLFYSNRDKNSTAFFDQLNEISQQNSNIKVVFTMTQDENWAGEKRRIDAKFLRGYVRDLDSSIFYIVGPPAMAEVLKKAAQEAGVPDSNIKTENFTGY